MYLCCFLFCFFVGGCQESGSQWVNQLFLFMNGTLLTFIYYPMLQCFGQDPIHMDLLRATRDTAFQLSLYDFFGGIHGVYRSSKVLSTWMVSLAHVRGLLRGLLRNNDGLHNPLTRPAISWGFTVALGGWGFDFH